MGVKAGCADALALLGTIELSMARLTPNCRAKPRATASGAWTLGEYQAKSRAGLSVGGGTVAQRAFAYPDRFRPNGVPRPAAAIPLSRPAAPPATWNGSYTSRTGRLCPNC